MRKKALLSLFLCFHFGPLLNILQNWGNFWSFNGGSWRTTHHLVCGHSAFIWKTLLSPMGIAPSTDKLVFGFPPLSYTSFQEPSHQVLSTKGVKSNKKQQPASWACLLDPSWACLSKLLICLIFLDILYPDQDSFIILSLISQIR